MPFPQPSPGDAPAVPTGPLQVARYQPEGDVPVAPYVAITFDQPMVEVGTVAQVNSGDVPATITPALEGTWQWVGTRTLRFDYGGAEVDRLPMATEYTVTVPAGTQSASGGVLAADVQFTFTTPAPTVQSLGPVHESMALDQLWVAVFDQRIDQEAVLAAISVTADGDDVPLRLATAAEIEADDTARNSVEQAAPGRWIAFRPTNDMPGDATVRVAVEAGAPSAEGPLTTDAAQSFTGRTYAPLRITEVGCNSGSPCRPGSGFNVQFNNQLDGSRIDVSDITVSPSLPGQRVSVQWSSIVIDGAAAPRTEYTITLPASITDVFGQTLGDPQQRTISVGEAQPSLQQFDLVTTLDPFADEQQLTVLSVNHDELRVRVFSVTPDDYGDYLQYTQERDWASPDLPGWEVLADTTVRPEGDADVPVLTSIDLSGALGGSPGHVVVLVEPVPAVSPNDDDYWMNRPALTWAQSTSLGVDIFHDTDSSVVWATDLRTGAPIADAQVRVVGESGIESSAAAQTDADGMARLEPPASGGQYQLLVATKGDDSAILPTWMSGGEWSDSMRWYVFDDRQVYRPGETMRVKGWVRRLDLSGDASLGLPADGATVTYTVNDSYGVELATGTVELGALGGFDLEIAIPDTANLGGAGVSLELLGEPGGSDQVGNLSNWHDFRIEEFRRPEFEVVTRPESQGPHLSTAPVTVAAEADYYAGGPLANAPVNWTVTTAEGTYAPPGWSGYTFGVWQPWWFWGVGANRDGGYADDGYWGEPCCGPGTEAEVDTYRGTTDANGAHYLQIGFEGDDGVLPDLPVVVTAEGAVEDVNRQVWASTTDLLVHAADRYVGLRTARSFVRQGDSLDVDVVVTDGAIVAVAKGAASPKDAARIDGKGKVV
ncbi:MAG TPA: hypothetical protein DCR14_01210, partial [Acidimicrobiaceae bacterium]|nr:hypothetical protein [Acidimicrobiaceae bacterium]